MSDKTKNDLHGSHADRFFGFLLGVLRQLAQGGEGGRIVNRSLGEHLAVHLDAGQLQTVHELGVVQAVHLAGCAATGDPEL